MTAGSSLRTLLQLIGCSLVFASSNSFSAAAELPAKDPYGGFQVGLQSFTLRNMEITEALDQSRKLGLGVIEIYPKHLPVTTVPGQLAEYRKLLSDRGIKLTGYGVVQMNSNESKMREMFDFAKAIDLPSIVANPNKDKATFDLLDKLVAEYQIPIAIHNHGPGSTYSTADDVLEWITGRNDLIGVCIDTGHYLRSDEDPVDVARKLKGRIYDVHLKDVRSIHTEAEKEQLYKQLTPRRAEQLRKEGKIFTILGEGELNLVGMLRTLRELGYEGPVQLEYEEHPENPLSDVELCLSNLRKAVSQLDQKETGFVPLWDGKSFAGWKAIENVDSWKIEDGALVTRGPRSHLLYEGELAPFKNFELMVDVLAEPQANGGIHFHTQPQESGWLTNGYEAQVNNTNAKEKRRTGSLYQVQDLDQQLIADNVWWTQHIIVNGKRVIIKVNGETVVDYTEPVDYTPPEKRSGRKLSSGTIALQAHDPGSVVHYRNVRIRKLPD